MIPLDILSDPICPWCHIGMARLDAAVAEAGADPFRRRWRMFRLNPDMPPEGMDRRAYLEAKFGGPEGAAEVYGRIAETAADARLEVEFDRIARTPNTLDAHRLLLWAEAEDAQDAVARALFDAYFARGLDISEHPVLLDIAERAGLDRGVVARLLEGRSDIGALEAEEAEARQMGVSGVPCFVINGRYVLQGAQETETWVRVIRELEASLAALRAEGSAEAAP